MDKNKNCALCGRLPEIEEPAVLALGKYGAPRYLCEECEADLDTATNDITGRFGGADK